MITASFTSSVPVCNVFCAEAAILAIKGQSANRCFMQGLTRASAVLGMTEFEVSYRLPKSGEFTGYVSVNGKRIPATVKFTGKDYPEVI